MASAGAIAAAAALHHSSSSSTSSSLDYFHHQECSSFPARRRRQFCSSSSSSFPTQQIADANPMMLRLRSGVRRRQVLVRSGSSNSNDWEWDKDGLADEIVRYGEFANACYQAFDLDPSSPSYLIGCKHRRSAILREVGLGASGYHVTRYVYASPDISLPAQPRRSRWIGYFAVSDDATSRRLGRRDVAVAFRGTVTPAEWVANFMSALTPAGLGPDEYDRRQVKVESGFLNLYTSGDDGEFASCRRQLLNEVSRLMKLYKNESVSITLAVHSMGSSLALLFAYDLAELSAAAAAELHVPSTIRVYSFGGPRVGNMAFKERCQELGLKVVRVVNVNDPITKIPGVLFNEKLSVFAQKHKLPWRTDLSCYAHVGTEVKLDFFSLEDPGFVHDLGNYLRWIKCSRREEEEKKKGDLVSKAGEFIVRTQKKIKTKWPWQINVRTLVQPEKKLDIMI